MLNFNKLAEVVEPIENEDAVSSTIVKVLAPEAVRLVVPILITSLPS